MKTIIAVLLLGSLTFAAEIKLGKALKEKETMPIDKLLASGDKYVNKTVQVKGKITEVCQAMGCWVMLADPESGKAVRIKVNEDEFTFPKDAAGKTAIAEGKFTKREMTKEQAIAAAKHEAEEQGKKFDPSKITAGGAVYQIQGSGAVIQ